MQRGVHVVVNGELLHAAHNATHAARHRHAVVGTARIGIDAGLVHHNLHRRFVNQIPLWRLRLKQVVRSLVKRRPHDAPKRQRALERQASAAVSARDLKIRRNRRGNRLRALVHHSLAVGHRHVVGTEERELRSLQRLSPLVEFLHHEAVLDVCYVQARGKLPLKVVGAAAHTHRVVDRNVSSVGGRRIEVLHGVANAGRGTHARVVLHDPLVGLDVAGHVGDLGLVHAVAVERKPVGIAGVGCLDHALHALACAHMPAVQSVSHYGVPRAV